MAIDKKKVTLLLLFDFSKTFGTISPTKLLHKLHLLGFGKSALLWIKSYLQDRSQAVLPKNSGLSSQLERNLGVPQGSVLGPLLFCLYVNDLRKILDRQTTNHIFYADDLQIYIHSSKDKIFEGLTRLSEAAKQVSEWAGNFGLRLNAAKTKAIFFGSKKRVNSINQMGLPGVAMQEFSSRSAAK